MFLYTKADLIGGFWCTVPEEDNSIDIGTFTGMQ